MRGVYSASYVISGLTTARTLMYITAPADMCIQILSAHIGNRSAETNEQLSAVFKRVGTLGTPTATAVTPAKHELSDQASGATVKANVTASEPTYTADTEFGREGFASVNGYRFQPTPEEQPIIAPGETVGLLSEVAVSTLDAVVSITFREIG